MSEDVKVQELNAVDSLVDILGEDQETKSAVAEFVQRVSKENAGFKVNGALVDSFIAEIDEVISKQMDEIIHAPEFQAIESAWRGLHHLVQNTSFNGPVVFDVLDAKKEEVYEDLEEAANGEGYEKQSGLWHHVYWDAYDKVGGHPYSSIIADYQLGNSNQDIQLLEHIAVLSESAQLPFVANVGTRFFDEESFDKVMNNRHLVEEVKQSGKFSAYRSFRENENSKFLGLCLPRFLGRLPYNANAEPTKNFNYTETILNGKSDNSLWCSASFAFASNMVHSFEEWGWSVKIVGMETGGKVAGLPTPVYNIDGQEKTKVPVESSVGQNKEQELCDLGFIPLAHWDRTDFACFFEAPSVQRPKEIKNDPEATANYSIGARLQYTMLVTRIAHYLKYKQLTHIGSNKGAGEIEKGLREWLNNITAEYDNAPESVVAKRPLREYKVVVKELPERPGFFTVEAEFRPHVAIIGMDIKLKMVAYISEDE